MNFILESNAKRKLFKRYLITFNMTFKKVKMIEDLPLSLGDRISLLLVYANQKPSTEIFIPSFYFNTKADLNRFVSHIDRKLQHINKPFINDGTKVRFFLGSDYSSEQARFYVGKDEAWCNRLKNSYDSFDEYETGACYGFPETAIAAYHGDRKRLMTSLKDGTPESYFTQFVFSKESFKEEFNSTSIPWHNTVKKLSKKMYSEVKEESPNYFDPFYSGYDHWTELMHSDEPVEDWALEKVWWG